MRFEYPIYACKTRANMQRTEIKRPRTKGLSCPIEQAACDISSASIRGLEHHWTEASIVYDTLSCDENDR